MSEVLETPCVLSATQYRQLWLDAADELGLVAETLADALGWQPTEAEPLPDALELAEVAAGRLASTTARRKSNCIGARQSKQFALN